MCLKLPMNHGMSNSLGLMEEVHFLVLGLSETQFHHQSLSLPVSPVCCQEMNIPKMLLSIHYSPVREPSKPTLPSLKAGISRLAVKLLRNCGLQPLTHTLPDQRASTLDLGHRFGAVDGLSILPLPHPHVFFPGNQMQCYLLGEITPPPVSLCFG